MRSDIINVKGQKVCKDNWVKSNQLNTENRVGCIIVTYNPDIEVLKSSLESVQKQVDLVLLVDNRSENRPDISKLAEDFKTEIIYNIENLGTSGGFNKGIDRLKLGNNIKWVLMLDQDTILPLNYVSSLLKRFQIADICHNRVWAIRGEEKYEGKSFDNNGSFNFKQIDSAIMSASLIKMEAFNYIKLREELFLDLVDNDFYYKVKKLGYIILSFDGIYSLHTLGRTIVIGGRPTTYENSYRTYFIVRNSVLLLCEGNMHFGLVLNIIASIIPMTYVEGLKTGVVTLVRGFVDGFRMKLSADFVSTRNNRKTE